MANYGARLFTFKALDGETYKTSLDSWVDQDLAGTAVKVYVKLVNLGDKTKLIAIDLDQAIKMGIEQLCTKAEAIRAAKAGRPVMTEADYAEAKIEAEKVAAVREAAIGGTASQKARGRYPWATKERRTEVTSVATKSKPVQSKPQPSKQVSTSTASMIAEEAKKLSKKH